LNIIFDLDGTLINSKPRLYKLFQMLVPASEISYTDYWDLKSSKKTHEIILRSKFGFDDLEIAKFTNQWMDLIESPEYLAFDEKFQFTHSTLLRLQSQAQLIVCTSRQHRLSALQQLERLNLLSFFSVILVTEQKTSKESLVISCLHNLNKNDWIIGDTGIDINTGKQLGIKTCAVLSGFLNHANLLEYDPDLVLNSINDFMI
jgi:phosphoglycolate phosphatase